MVQALAEPRPEGSLQDVEHVVVFMQENRSFDHYYGTLKGVRGFADNSALPGVFNQSGVHPFLARDAANRGQLSVEFLASLPHNWEDGQQALNGGKCDQWIGAKGQATMASYDRQDIPFQFALAETFTICDGYFCSSPTSTSPNRNFLFSGASFNEPDGRRAVDNDAYEPEHTGYTWSTYAEELQKAGVDWKVYQEWDNFTDNNLDFFKRFRDIGRAAVSKAGEKGLDLTGFYEDVLKMQESDENHPNPKAKPEQLARAKKVHDAAASLGKEQAELYDRALFRGEPGSLVERFAKDVTEGTLPKVSWIVATAADCEHPSSSSPIQFSNLTYRLLDTLAQHPEVWRKTAVLIMFDEFDGYFDHVVPPLPPKGEKDEWNGLQPMGLGFRVPMTIISPWSAGGLVSSEVFDHTSVVRFLERVTGVDCPNISDWRRRVCGDLVGTLDFSKSDGMHVPDQPGPVPHFEKRWKAQPGGELPQQESGQATALPTPYQLAADVVEGELVLVNDGPRAAVFACYLGDTRIEHVTVQGTERVQLPPLCKHVVVCGPDRFLRDLRFAPGKSSPKVELDHAGGTVRIDARPLDAARNVKDGWYEFTVPSNAGASYYTGRLESGKRTKTSPFSKSLADTGAKAPSSTAASGTPAPEAPASSEPAVPAGSSPDLPGSMGSS